MKIDDKGRAFFSSIETLERMDQLQEAVEAYVDDVAPRVLGAIATATTTLLDELTTWLSNAEVLVLKFVSPA